MNKTVAEYLDSAKKSNKLISLKDEVNVVFTEEVEGRKMYLKIWNIAKREKIHSEKLYQVIHIRYNDFLNILEKLK